MSVHASRRLFFADTLTGARVELALGMVAGLLVGGSSVAWLFVLGGMA